MKSRLPMTQRELIATANEICSNAIEKKWLVDSLKILTKEVFKQKKIMGLVTYPDLRLRWYVREVVTGGRWKNQGRQRRKIKLTFPNREQGRPKHDYASYLMIKLGELYVRITGQGPTRGGTSSKFSRFERFAYRVHTALGIGNFRNRVRNYLLWRQSQGL